MFYEIRRETALPGRGEELARWMDEQVIPLHEAHGMVVVGAFTEAEDEDAFVWIRQFRSDQERREIVERVHRDPLFESDVRPRLGEFLAGDAVTVRLVPTARSRLRRRPNQ
ncbi:NIPSNAP family protein [Virgisporangium aliadipatigenens]|uniref:NIPSNAP family protein n=1 Tax=Virgisporangium aliadipatigenens TaxID=741659 RepID=A0A8J3YS07_9ACTN|nr:NIPSNAP family protein [Virgisporangium aliadipatigenens]GIJ48885.1 NIPSNAP family protein [Virgisporangium aliadipatigenens]